MKKRVSKKGTGAAAGKKFENISYSSPTYNSLDTSHLMSDLKGRSVRGGAVTLASQGVKFVLQMASTIILARLLIPSDYGLVAMVSAIVGFAALFKDLGLSMATIQQNAITHEQVSFLFWINVAISCILAGALCAIAPIITYFYHEPRLTSITFILACTFVFSGLSVQHLALLRRQMKFTTIGWIEIISMAVGVTCAVTMAKLGLGYWALVGMTFSSAICNAGLLWYFCPWRPRRARYDSGVRKMLKLGSHITGFSLINYFSRNLDNILIGHFCGAETLGLYAKAYSIMMLPIQQIRGPLEAVAMPALSRLQGDEVRYRSYYLKLISIVAFMSMPVMVFLFVCSDDVILLLLGPNWAGTGAIFKVLCLVSFIQPIASTRGIVLVSLGLSEKYFKWGMLNGIVTITSFLIGLPWGALGVAICYTMSNYLFLFPSLWYTFKETPITIRSFVIAVTGPVVASIIMGIIIFLIRSLLPHMLIILSVSLLLLISSFLYLATWYLVPQGQVFLKELVTYRRHFKSRMGNT